MKNIFDQKNEERKYLFRFFKILDRWRQSEDPELHETRETGPPESSNSQS